MLLKILFNQQRTFHGYILYMDIGDILILDMSFPHFKTVKFRLTTLKVFVLYLEAEDG